VRKGPPEEGASDDAATEEASQYLKDITERVEKIKNDDSIPVRANKKKGLRSKKELREEIQNEAAEKLKEISIRHGFVVGKWLIFATPDKVDAIWSTIATSLITGPLSSTCAKVAKVSTSPQNETPDYKHVLCLYMPDVYDKAKVTEVMKVLLGQHGMSLMGVKSDLYTAIGLDSKHSSGVQSTIWKNSALMKDSEMKELKDKYFAGLNSAKTDKAEKSGALAKSKPALKKRAAEEDPFASDEDDDKQAAGTSKESAMKPASKQATSSKIKAKSKKVEDDAFGSDEVSEDEVKAERSRKAVVAAKKGPAKPMSKRLKDEEDDEDEDRPQPKRRQVRK